MPKILRARAAQDEKEKQRVRKLAASRHRPADWIFHAGMVVRSWDGQGVQAIATDLDCSPQTVRRRLHRFDAEGIEGLGDRPKHGRPRRLRTEDDSRIIALMRQAPPGRLVTREEGTRGACDEKKPAQWSLDALALAAKEAGVQVKRSQIRRILLRERVRRRTHRWGTPRDKDSAPKGLRSSPTIRLRKRDRRSSATTRRVDQSCLGGYSMRRPNPVGQDACHHCSASPTQGVRAGWPTKIRPVLVLVLLVSFVCAACGSTPAAQSSTRTPTPPPEPSLGSTPAAQTSTVLPTLAPLPPTPSAPRPTQPPASPALLDVEPASLSLVGHRDCQQITEFLCQIRVLSRASNRSVLSWRASSNMPAGVTFTPSSGVLAPGQSILVDIFLPLTACTHGLFFFWGPANMRTITWSC